MFTSLLIANRGEIACRIARTARRMGVRTIAVYSEADSDAPHVRAADEAHPIGPAPATESYLRIGRILSVAKAAGAQAIHPGYGFLSENGDFAGLCRDAGIVFVGPPAEAMRDMGLKDRAKAIMAAAGVPVVPGYAGDNQKPDFLKRKAYEIGYPVLVKAVAGGGGKGMRVVERALDFDEALAAAKREAEGAFGNDRVLIERYVANPRHIEFQVFADGHGNVVHLWERDCSLQRRHQKVIEEAPAPGMTEALRTRMGEAACAAARAVAYEGAGTVEFIVDGAALARGETDAFFFMEMNTRLQVEHPVTEMLTGFDLVEWQLRVADGQRLPMAQDAIDAAIASRARHAMEARLYAEDATRGFLPSTGRIHALSFPASTSNNGVRIDAGVEQGSTVSPHYDPMIAKVIVEAGDRDEAIAALDEALAGTVVVGPQSNVAFLRACLADPDFRSGTFDTGLIGAKLDALVPEVQVDENDVRQAAGAMMRERRDAAAEEARRFDPHGLSPWSVADSFQLGPPRETSLRLVHEGDTVEVRDPQPVEAPNAFALDDGAVVILRDGHQFRFDPFDPSVAAEGGETGSGAVRTPMTGRVIAVQVAQGDAVERGAPLFAVEAMKMEHLVTAPFAGRVESVAVAVGDQVADRTVCVTLADG